MLDVSLKLIKFNLILIKLFYLPVSCTSVKIFLCLVIVLSSEDNSLGAYLLHHEIKQPALKFLFSREPRAIRVGASHMGNRHYSSQSHSYDVKNKVGSCIC